MGVFSGTQTKMVAKALAQALLLLPLISAQPPPPECCLEKEVGGILYQYVKSGAVASRCSNDCIYEKVDMPGKYFCFAPGDLHVECEDDEVTDAPGGPAGECVPRENISWGEYQVTIEVPDGLPAAFEVVITFSHPATVGSCHSGCDPSSVFSSQESAADTSITFTYTPPTHNGIEPLRLFNIKRWPKEGESDFAEITSVTFDGEEQC